MHILHRGHRDGGGQRGSATVEYAVLVPLVLMLLLSVVQAGLWWHTRNVCLHAAQHASHAARTLGATPRDAHHAAHAFLTHAESPAADPTITATVTDRAITVEVAATAPRVVPIPGLEPRVTQSAHVARERFTTPGGGLP